MPVEPPHPNEPCMSPPYSLMVGSTCNSPPNNGRRIPVVQQSLYLGSTLNVGRPSPAQPQVSAVFSIPPQSAASRRRPLERGQRLQRVYPETARVSAKKVGKSSYIPRHSALSLFAS
ncbi:hypothetical protein K438DRAFT_1985194 [Mycena galopus ATCC 62051]|nr:hypothetical protein K438DRAFT_1985194 [Mycena galopus ATCC 62051]